MTDSNPEVQQLTEKRVREITREERERMKEEARESLKGILPSAHEEVSVPESR